MSHREISSKGASALLAAAFIYAMFGVLIREMATMWSDEAQVVARFAVAFLLLLLYGYFRHVKQRIPKKKLPYVIGLGISFAMVVFTFTIAINRTTLANTVFLLYGGSIVTSFLIGTLVLKEQVTKIKLCAIGLALVGLALYSHAILALSAGVVAGLASGLFDGVSNSLRKPLKDVDRNSILRLQYGISTLFTAVILAFSTGPNVHKISFTASLVTVLFGVLLVCLGNLLLYGFQHFDVNVGTVILSMELVFAAVLGLIFYNEVPAMNEIVGGAFIFFASILSSVNVKDLFQRRRAVVT